MAEPIAKIVREHLRVGGELIREYSQKIGLETQADYTAAAMALVILLIFLILCVLPCLLCNRPEKDDKAE
jgi:ascorbate-specific PTS system EIIC-type component UlaA